PWTVAPVSYEVVANPGDFAVARGQSLPISCHVKPIGSADSLPSKATLVMTEANGKTVRLGMKSDQPNIFFIKFNSVTDTFRYRMEAGDATTPEHTVTAVDPVQLTADSPTIIVTPPAYAQKTVETKTLNGLGDFSALQYGTLAFEFRFNRPAQKATLE